MGGSSRPRVVEQTEPMSEMRMPRLGSRYAHIAVPSTSSMRNGIHSGTGRPFQCTGGSHPASHAHKRARAR
eukprot:6091695-Pyramimonas_sp.AAC.1